MRVVVALGGNALLRRGEQMTDEKQRQNVRAAAKQLAPLAAGNDLIVCHGNGPQIGLLALQAAMYEQEAHLPSYPLDTLGAQTQGMIGYLLELELGNCLPFERPLATVLTMIEIDPGDDAFRDPTKFIGPVYSKPEADALRTAKGWTIKMDGDSFRRVVPSPRPKRIFESRQIEWLLEKQCIVICAGGGGIPTAYGAARQLAGVEAVIDKDHSSGLLARDVRAEMFVMATDVDGVYLDWNTAAARGIARAHPDALDEHGEHFPAGSMGPKVAAACEFARATGHPAAIGSLSDLMQVVSGERGTLISTTTEGIVYRDPEEEQ